MPKEIGLLWLFDRYDSPGDFENRTGEPAPPFDPGRPPKFWRDLSALKVPRRFVYYDIVALERNGVTVSKGPDGKPYVGTLRGSSNRKPANWRYERPGRRRTGGPNADWHVRGRGIPRLGYAHAFPQSSSDPQQE